MGLLIFITAILLMKLASAKFSDGQCGVEASSNPLHRNPWAVLLEYYWRGQLTEIRCAGSLIDSRHVITAAHCVRRFKRFVLQVRLGDYNLSTEIDCVDGICADPYLVRFVDKIFVHHGYNNKEHDIAIIRLNKPVPYTDFIRPVCLPTGVAESKVFNAAGWGEVVHAGRYSEVKKSIPLSLWPHDDCRHIYRRDTIPRLSICAGGQRDVDTCRGDSGGPLTATRRHIELFGVTSSGSVSCGRAGAPGIYTSVREHLPWVNKIVRVS